MKRAALLLFALSLTGCVMPPSPPSPHCHQQYHCPPAVFCPPVIVEPAN